MDSFYEKLKLELEKQLAVIAAENDATCLYAAAVLKILIAALESLMREENPEAEGILGKLFWTGPKVSLIELIYSLHSVGVINNGNVSPMAITAAFEQAFNVELGYYRKKFAEVCARKSERTKFLTLLQEKLIQRMDDADEHSP